MMSFEQCFISTSSMTYERDIVITWRIIAVMTAIAVVQSTMEKEMSVLGAQTFQVQKWPAGGFN